MECPNDVLAARLLAMWDDAKGTDTADRILEHSEASDVAALHNAAMGAELSDKRNKNLYARIGLSQELKSPRQPHLIKEAGLLRGITDLDVTRREVLGAEIVDPVIKANHTFRQELAKFAQENPELYKNRNKPEYKEEWRENANNIAMDTGYLDALEQAKQDIQDFYGDGIDPDRKEYGDNWLEDSQSKSGFMRAIEDLNQNLITGITKNNLLLIERHVFDNFRVAEAYGPKIWWDAWQQVGKLSPEEAANIQTSAMPYEADATNLFDKVVKFDLMHKLATINQKVTYLGAKMFAAENGLDPEPYAQKAVETLMFRTSPMNQPRAFSNSHGLLGLMKYGVMERRWVQSIAKNGLEGWKTRNTIEGRQLLNQSIKTLATFGMIRAAVFGASSNLPAETDWYTMFHPNAEEFLANIDKYSLFGMLTNGGIDMGKYSRIPVTPIGLINRIGLFFNDFAKLKDNYQKAMEHPDSTREWEQAIVGTIRIAPDKTPLGNGNIANIVDAMYRQASGNYKRYTAKGQPYETSPQEEWENVIERSGHQSLERRIQKLELEQHK